MARTLIVINRLSPSIWCPVPLGSIPELPADSCTEIKASEGGQVVSGNYWLDPEKNGNSVKLYCDMTTDGGKWWIFPWVNRMLSEDYGTPTLSYEVIIPWYVVLILLYVVFSSLYAVLMSLYAVLISLYAVLMSLYSVLISLYAVIISLYAVLRSLCAVLMSFYVVLHQYIWCMFHYIRW